MDLMLVGLLYGLQPYTGFLCGLREKKKRYAQLGKKD